MQRFIAALGAAKPAQLPQLGLRLANRLAGPRPPQQFWMEYVRMTGEAGTFSRLSPHSKCLLTCVACRLGSDVAKASQADQLVKRVFKDVISAKALCLLNLELINMLLVASYTLKVPISTEQMQQILTRGHQLVEQNNYFNVEFTVSILHSLGSLARAYPRLRPQISSSDLLRWVMVNFDTLSRSLNTRELSLVTYAFDKLHVLNDTLASVIVENVKAKQSEIEGQTLSTILLACASHPGTSHVLTILRENVRKTAANVTGREACNICCAYLKAGRWDESLFSLLESALPGMNPQELCNVVNLMIHKNVNPTHSFKDSYIDHINAAVGRFQLSLLDALTLAQSLSCWGLMQRVKKQDLDRALTLVIQSDKSTVCSKHVYLLHYCFTIECHRAAVACTKMIAASLDAHALNNKEMVVLYNAMCNIDAEKEAVVKVEDIIRRRLTEGKRFSDIDMQTLAYWGDVNMLRLITKSRFGGNLVPNYMNTKLLALIVKGYQNEETIELARHAIEKTLIGTHQAVDSLQKGDNAPSTINGAYVHATPEIRHDCRTVVATCEILPVMQGKMDVVSIFGDTLARISAEYGFQNIDVKLLVALLSVARKLNVRLEDLTLIANLVMQGLDGDITHLGFLEYLNAVYRLEIEVTDVHKVLKYAERVIIASCENRVKEAIALTLASMCFSGIIPANAISTVIASVLAYPGKSTYMLEKALFLYLQSNGPTTLSMYDGIEEMLYRMRQRKINGPTLHRQTTRANSYTAEQTDLHRDIAEEQNQVQSSVYATLQKYLDSGTKPGMVCAEAPLAFDYIADILITRL
ncbi:hypothetical protein X943_002081 [Babesia divergens]|uniref:Uncharacterized protein n=1 Tax=Babesia divergens TaxID=32595 RepID=A0AAD9G787_BABDI|nr:hypothetical protein X943_002081 [Babesia divergens]